jgi:hypothetical protein
MRDHILCIVLLDLHLPALGVVTFPFLYRSKYGHHYVYTLDKGNLIAAHFHWKLLLLGSSIVIAITTYIELFL